MRSAVVAAVLIAAAVPAARADTVTPPSSTTPTPSRPPAQIRQRFGIDGVATAGTALTAGVSMRFEQAVKRDGYLISRMTVQSGLVLEAEDNGFEAGTAHLGYRGYWGGLYLAAEAGVVAVRRREYTDMDGVDRSPRVTTLPSAAVSIGGKRSGLDVGVSLQFPFVFGVHLGVDLYAK